MKQQLSIATTASLAITAGLLAVVSWADVTTNRWTLRTSSTPQRHHSAARPTIKPTSTQPSVTGRASAIEPSHLHPGAKDYVHIADAGKKVPDEDIQPPIISDPTLAQISDVPPESAGSAKATDSEPITLESCPRDENQCGCSTSCGDNCDCSLCRWGGAFDHCWWRANSWLVSTWHEPGVAMACDTGCQTDFDPCYSDKQKCSANACRACSNEPGDNGCCASDCGACTTAPGDCCGPWYGEFGFVLLDRNNTSHTYLATDGQRNLTSDNVNFDAEAGPFLTIGREFNCCTSFEFVYFGIENFDGSAKLVPQSGFASSPYLGGSIDGFFDTRITENYESELHNAEWNFLRSRGNGCYDCAVIAGVRYINFEEDFRLQGRDSFIPTDALTSSSTTNDLVGFQLGFDLSHDVAKRAAVGIDSKIGLFVNFQEQSLRNSVNGVSDLSRQNSEAEAALAVDFGVSLGYRPLESRNVLLKIGYKLFYVDGLALAPDQLQLLGAAIQDDAITSSTGRGLLGDGSVFFHGGLFAVEIVR